jgi:hypothetical protein
VKVGDKLVVTRKGNISQCYIPWGAVCEYIKLYETWVCVAYDGKEMLINKELLVKLVE